MKMISAVVEVGVSVSTQLQTCQRRYDAESSKLPQDQATQRLEELQAVIKEVSHSAPHLTHTLDPFSLSFSFRSSPVFSLSFSLSLSLTRLIPFLIFYPHNTIFECPSLFNMPLRTITRGSG